MVEYISRKSQTPFRTDFRRAEGKGSGGDERNRPDDVLIANAAGSLLDGGSGSDVLTSQPMKPLTRSTFTAAICSNSSTTSISRISRSFAKIGAGFLA